MFEKTKSLSWVIAFLFTMSQSVLGWDGKGTSTEPYLIATSADWQQLATDVNGGMSFSGNVFRLAGDIDVGGVSVGNSNRTPFSGTFDGNGHTLTYNVGIGDEVAAEACAPFRHVSEATFRHLNTTGIINTSHQYAGGIVSMVGGDTPTMLIDCTSKMRITSWQMNGNEVFGGLVGCVNKGGLVVDHCQAEVFFGVKENCGGLVGWSNVGVTITNSMSKVLNDYGTTGCATFARMADGAVLTLDKSYYTMVYGISQGQFVFNTISLPEGCKAEFVSEPVVQYDGEDYWSEGAQVYLSAPDGVAFNHWSGGGNKGCFISDPWTRDGIHRLEDLNAQPALTIRTAMPEVPAGNLRTMDGTKYRYLSVHDYHLYVSNAMMAAKGWELRDGFVQKYVTGEQKWAYITAVDGWEPGSIPSDGAQIHNDLTGDWYGHTLMGIIAPHAFDGCTELETLYFKDTDANNYNALENFDFVIGDYAFSNCPNLTEVKLIQYTTRGDNHWEYLTPGQVTAVGDHVFSGSPKAVFSCQDKLYQQYLDAPQWKPFRSRMVIYQATPQDFTINGVKYGQYYDDGGRTELTNGNKDVLIERLKTWNADYQQFSVASLLDAFDESQNIYYTSVVGLDDGYLDRHDGKAVILNDLGTYHNYKTICLDRTAFAGNQHLKSIEFRQVNGNQTSRSNLKMVIQNGAFAHCDNLRELRLYYWCEDGDDHWEVLGPENVIPGDNIFGLPSDSDYDKMSEAEYLATSTIPEDFRIIVSPSRYDDFLEDPNWSRYSAYIAAADYEPTTWEPIEEDGLLYDYASSTVNVASTDQVVTQNLSWWNVPIKVYELLNLSQLVTDIVNFVPSLAEITKKYLRQLASFDAQHKSSMAPIVKDIKTLKAVDTNNPNFDFLWGNKGNFEASEWVWPETKEGMKAFQEGIVKWGGDFNKRFLWTDGLKETLATDKNKVKVLMKALWAGIADRQSVVARTFKPMYTSARKAYLKQVGKLIGEYNGILQSSAVASAYPMFQGMGYDMSEEQFQRGLAENIKANIHNVSYENTLVYTPDKKLIYHVYVQKPTREQDSITIYNDLGRAWNYRTVAIQKSAFQGNKTLRKVAFAENAVAGSDSYVPMRLAIPDSAFADCRNLERFYLTYKTRNGGMRSLGPENFVLGGDSIFAGCDPQKFRIVIDAERKEDFLNSDSWKHYERYFVYTDVKEKRYDHEYGVNYALFYDNNTTQRVTRISGHKVEHLMAISADDDFLKGHQGSMGLMNDIGTYNNYKLDLVKRRAFKGNKNIRVVSFWDLNGGDSYTTLNMELGDSCFLDCTNMANIDMLYCVTDGDDHIEPLRPTQVRAGKGMFDGTEARIKMMPQQMEWFLNDSAWTKYSDRFMPCIIQPADEGVREALKDMCYYTPCCTPYRWTDYIDLARIGGAGFSWLDGRFTAEKDDILAFPDFKYFESVGLDYVGSQWFKDCDQLSTILLPSTIRRIEGAAFEGCSKLEEIELPESVEFIAGRSFMGCGLKSVIVRGETPARLESNPFPYNEGMKIHVPAGRAEAYRQAWPDYAQYIVSDTHPVNKHVTTTKKGELASKLGLTIETSYTGLMYGDELYRVHGNYAKYDSLTISGPLDDLDLSVIRYLCGADSYHKGGGYSTDGCLRYLDLSGADIREGSKYNYIHLGTLSMSDRYAITADDELPRSLFNNCRALESLILPRSLKNVRIEAFNAPNLKRICFTNDVAIKYDDRRAAFLGVGTNLLCAPLEELVFLTGGVATSDHSDPWGYPMKTVYSYNTQLGDYSGHPYLSSRAMNIAAPFDDDAVTRTLAAHELYFPSQYLGRESVENLFEGAAITRFDDFSKFDQVKRLIATFRGCADMKVISLPPSIEHISADAFAGCTALDSISVYCDSVPELAHDAFRDLPAGFKILVPKKLCKLYRTKWPQYADHINEYVYQSNDLITVTVTEPNTLDKALGLEMSYKSDWSFSNVKPTGMKGSYGHISRLKVVGPISGGDLALLRHLAGYTPWTDSRNYLGHLEYLDLYDAKLVVSDYETAPDKLTIETNFFDGGKDTYPHKVDQENSLPKYALLKAYTLKTLILPKSCSHVRTRALQECEDLETLVIGDDMQEFNWDALDDCASLIRLYILTPSKLKLTSEFFVWRWMCNNYNPTFDAFYVRPSQYEAYAFDDVYTGSSWQRTNNVQTGIFDGDDEFCAFGAHAVGTIDDLTGVTSVEGWFDGRKNIHDLTALRYTAIDSLSARTFQDLPHLQQVALPISLDTIADNIFKTNEELRYVDMLMCDSTMVVQRMRDGGLQKLGIDTQRTLVYLPSHYGDTSETNVVVASAPAGGSSDGNDAASGSSDGSGDASGASLKAACFRLVDDRDYLVPYSFEAEKIENSRSLPKHDIPYTVCVPYTLDVPQYARAFKLSDRDGSTLTFKELAEGEKMEALQPYLLKVVGNKRFRKSSTTLNSNIRQTIPATGGMTYGRQVDVAGYSLRGTLDAVDNKTAADMGAYVLQGDGNWHPVSAATADGQKASVLPFRAFLLPSARNAGAPAIDMELIDATDIDTIETIDRDGTRRYYDLQGREVDASHKGVVISGGKKYLNK